MKLKKFVALIFCLIMMISCMVVAASAETDSQASVTISASSSEVKVGETVTFTVSLDATNIYSYDCKISLPEGMELVGSVTAHSISSNFWAPQANGLRVYSTGYNAGAAGGVGFTGGGEIATFTCKVTREGAVSVSVTATGEKYSEKLGQNVNYDFDGNPGEALVTIFCEHYYEPVVTAPTCTEQGYTTHICSFCGRSYEDSYQDALGHIPQAIASCAATCTEDGLTEGTDCSVCGQVLVPQESIPHLGHRYVVTGENVSCVRCEAKLKLSLSREYILLDLETCSKVTMNVECNQSDFVKEVQWSVDDESVITVKGNGNVTARGVGTAYVIATVSDGETTLTARCRVDVSEKLVLDGVQLSATKATTELYKTSYTELEFLLKLPQNYPQILNQRTSRGVAVKDARFAEASVDALFELKVLDDRHVQIVPRQTAVDNPKNVKSSYKSAITVTVGDREYTTEEVLALTVKKSTPKVTAKVAAFNSFYTGQSNRITFKGATVKKVVPVNGVKWLTLENDLLTIADSAPKSASGTMKLQVHTAEWRIPATVSLSVKNTYKAPGLKLSATTVTLSKDALYSNGIQMKLQCKNTKDTLEGLNVTDIIAPEGYAVADFNIADGSFVLKANEGFKSGKITLKVRFSDTATEMSLALTVKTANVALKLSKTSITLNTATKDSAEISVTVTPKDYKIQDYELKLENSSQEGQLDYRYENGKIYVSVNEATKANTTYKLKFTAGGKSVTLTVKTVNKKPEVSLKAVNAMDLSFPDKQSTVTATFKNYSGAILDYDFTITEKKGKTVVDADAADKFTVELDGKTLRIRVKDGAQVDTKNTYVLSLKLTLADGTEMPEKTVSLTVKRTAVKLKLSKSSLTLNKSVFDKGNIKVTCATKGYAYTGPIWTITDSKGNAADSELNLSYADGRLIVATNEETVCGKTYKIKMKANEYAPVSTLTVSVLSQSKSAVTASLKASGSLDVIRDGSAITVTPSYKNVTECTKINETLTVYSSADNYTKPVNHLFNISRNTAGAFVLTKADGVAIDHSLKYKVKLTTVFNETVTVETKPVNISVKMGTAKLTLTAEDATLFSKDMNDRVVFTIRGEDKTLNEIAEITVKDSKYQDLFEIYEYGNGKYAIGFMDGHVDSKLIGKSITVNLNVKLEGNETAKVNTTLKLKLTITK